MRIGFLLPANYALTGPGNGVRAQAVYQAEALERLGLEVVRLDSWNLCPGIAELDVVQFFLGGYAHFTIQVNRPHPVRMLAYAPIIDSNEPWWRYRAAAWLGSISGRLNTVPGAFRQQCLGSDLVVCRSRHERERVIRGLGVSPTRTGIEIVLNGVDPPPPADPTLARRAYGLPDAYALHVGRFIDPRKNVFRLVEAIGPTGIPLVIAGSAPPGATLDRLKSLAAKHPQIRILGEQERTMLNSLYAGCRVFCLPSLHEGTGLVALEAAAYGAAVVITRNGGPPDYFGDMAEYVDPLNVIAIREAIARAWAASPTERLRRHVIDNLSWDRSARSLVEAYQKHAPR
jgi:glycosyltransferase involved in cell wall biosynthesis